MYIVNDTFFKLLIHIILLYNYSVYKKDERPIQLDIIFIKIFFTFILVNYNQESILLLFLF